MTTTVQFTIDCADPQAQARFWMSALRYVIEPPPQGHETWDSWLAAMGVPEPEWNDGAWISDPEGRGPKLYFQKVPEPKTVKNRLHLDLDIATRDEPVANPRGGRRGRGRPPGGRGRNSPPTGQ